MEMTHIEVKLARATTLPILPNVITELLTLTQDADIGLREYERVIVQDAALAAKILRTANSPFFGGNGQITTLRRALNQLGVNNIRSIGLAVAFQSALSSRTLHKRFNVACFWQHSLAVACGAKLLACLRRDPLAEEAFIAGLVHDIGKLALCMFLPAEAGVIYHRMEVSRKPQFEVEQECLKVTHQEIGMLAAQRWGLPEVYFAPISKHHTPTEGVFEIDALTAYVHVANALAHEIGLGDSPADMLSVTDPLVLFHLDIAEAQYDPLRKTIAQEVARLSTQLGL